MRDRYEREIDYIRISVTDRCNLRCRYCMPEGVELIAMEELLTFEEIVKAVRAAAELGIRHVRLTGGEPLVRRGVTALVHMLKEVSGIEKVTMTTNGILLRENLVLLKQAGLDAVNISLDTADRKKYAQITGKDALPEVLSAIDAACEAGIQTKINAVSLNQGEQSLWDLIALAKDRPVDVRFIELMPIGYGKTFPVYSHQELMVLMKAHFRQLEEDHTIHGFGPAVYYRIPGFQGCIGLISAIHGKFCGSCNRVRLTSTGFLKACLCYNKGADLREILRSDTEPEEKEQRLKETMEAVIFEKPQAHCFENRDEITETAVMSAIGG